MLARIIRTNSSFKRLFSTTLNDIYIIGGGGSTGRAMTTSLLLGSHANRVVVVDLPEAVSDIRKGINLTGVTNASVNCDGNQLVFADCVTEGLLNTMEKTAIVGRPVVFHMTRGPDAIAALGSVELLFRANLDPIMICLQNGLGIENLVSNYLKSKSFLHNSPVLKGQMFFSALRSEGGVSVPVKGEVSVGCSDEDVGKKLTSVFDKSELIDLILSDDLRSSLALKLSTNCAANPLSVIFNRRLKWIGENLQPIMSKVIDEIYELAVLSKISMQPKKDFIDGIVEFAKSFGDSSTSMYNDIVAGRKTEISQLNGAVNDMMGQFGEVAPVNKMIADMIMEIEKMRDSCKSAEEFYEKHDDDLNSFQKELFSAVA